MTTISLAQFDGLQSSVRLLQVSADTYRITLHYNRSTMHTHNRAYTLISYEMAHRRFVQLTQRALFYEDTTGEDELEECRVASTALWECERKDTVQLRNRISERAEQIA